MESLVLAVLEETLIFGATSLARVVFRRGVAPRPYILSARRAVVPATVSA